MSHLDSEQHTNRNKPNEVIGNDCSWHLVPLFLLRSSGFPFEWLTSLELLETGRLANSMMSLNDMISDLQSDFQDNLFPNIVKEQKQLDVSSDNLRQLNSLSLCVSKKRSISQALHKLLTPLNPTIGEWIHYWNTVLVDYTSAEREFSSICETEFNKTRKALHDYARNHRFQEALWLSNPNMYDGAFASYLHRYSAGKRPSKIKYHERQIYAYLQRFCAKNDTTSFFGPIDYGEIDTQLIDRFHVKRLQADIPWRRLTRYSYWAVQTLADLIAKDDEITPYLVPRLQDGLSIKSDGTLLDTIHDRKISLPAKATSLLGWIDGKRTVIEIESIMGQPCLPALRLLSQKAVLILNIRIPTTTIDPLAWLIEWLTGLPELFSCRDLWIDRLTQMHQSLNKFSSQPLDEKVSQLKKLELTFRNWTHLDARRGEGEIYSDRLLIYDEAKGDVESCRVGKTFHREISKQLSPALDLCAYYSMLVQKSCRKQAINVFREMTRRDRVPYLAFIRQIDKTITLENCISEPMVSRWIEQLHSILRNSKSNDHHIRIRSVNLASIIGLIEIGTVVSPDILINAPSLQAIQEGNYQIVLGEIHHGVQVWCHLLSFYPDRDKLELTLENMLKYAPTEKQPTNLIFERSQGKVFVNELPGFSAEILGRSLKPANEAFPVAELEVGFNPNGELGLFRQNTEVKIYPVDPRAVSNWLFGSPPVIAPSITMGTHTPRIYIDHLVFQRANWLFSSSDWMPLPASPGELMLHITKIRKHFKLPHLGFVHLSDERKPFFVDLKSVLSVELFYSMIKKTETFLFSEMMPGPGEFWLDNAGMHRTCEWRMSAVYLSN